MDRRSFLRRVLSVVAVGASAPAVIASLPSSAPLTPAALTFKGIPLVFDQYDALDVTRVDVFDGCEYSWKEVAASYYWEPGGILTPVTTPFDGGEDAGPETLDSPGVGGGMMCPRPGL